MRGRWWDGASRGVVSRRRGRSLTLKGCWVETLDCGHEQARPQVGASGPYRICHECARNGQEARP
jgi:hypothetical protein